MSRELLGQIREAFVGTPRPEHFTHYQHCAECFEHDAVLRTHTPNSIGFTELGNPGWDPMCFVRTDGYLYYLPALARLALGTGEECYLDQFRFHLNVERVLAMTLEQRRAVLHLLEHLREQRRDEIEVDCDLGDLNESIQMLSLHVGGAQNEAGL